MELELEGGGFEVEGNVEIELPDYMVMLPQAELDEARRAVQRNQMIIAAGRKPDTNEIVLMTAVGRLLSLEPEQHGIPAGPVFPIDFGHTVAVEVKGGYFEIASDWLVENSTEVNMTVST